MNNKLVKFVLWGAILLRILLLFINKEANDDHIEPIQRWIAHGSYPLPYDCFECFQPPGFYWVIKFLAVKTGHTSYEGIRWIFQSVNLLLSISVELLVFLFLKKTINDPRKLLAHFTFWSFNPKLIGIGAQATNDLILIFLGMVFTWVLLKLNAHSNKLKSIISLGLIALFAALFKGNGLVIYIVFSVLSLYLIFTRIPKYQKITLSLMLMLMPVVIGLWGGYYAKYKAYNNPFIINQFKAPAPAWTGTDTLFKGRMGVRNISEAYFSFRIVSLLQSPYNINESFYPPHPLHRESFFTQLYGQFSNVLFERHPFSWICKNNDMLNFSRVNYILLLPLLGLFIFSFIIQFQKGILQLFKGDILNEPLIHTGMFALFLAFTIKYSYDYRDFSNMKFIFILPSLLSMLWIFSQYQFKTKFNLMIEILMYSSALLMLINLGYFVLTLQGLV